MPGCSALAAGAAHAASHCSCTLQPPTSSSTPGTPLLSCLRAPHSPRFFQCQPKVPERLTPGSWVHWWLQERSCLQSELLEKPQPQLPCCLGSWVQRISPPGRMHTLHISCFFHSVFHRDWEKLFQMFTLPTESWLFYSVNCSMAPKGTCYSRLPPHTSSPRDFSVQITGSTPADRCLLQSLAVRV